MNKTLGVMMLSIGSAVAAADAPTEKVPAELRSCVGIERNTERLACFDRGVAALMGAAGATAPSAESSFGLVASTPRVQTARGEASEELRTVRGKVTALKNLNGDEVITLDNGQVWRQLSGGQLLLKVGDDVEINRAALGSFQMKVPSGRSGKVKRLR
jgi:hypothetical protein